MSLFGIRDSRFNADKHGSLPVCQARTIQTKKVLLIYLLADDCVHFLYRLIKDAQRVTFHRAKVMLIVLRINYSQYYFQLFHFVDVVSEVGI